MSCRARPGRPGAVPVLGRAARPSSVLARPRILGRALRATQRADPLVQGHFEVRDLPGGQHDQHSALKTGQQRGRPPVRVHRSRDLAAGLHTADPVGDLLLPPAEQPDHHLLVLRRARPELGGEHGQGTGLALGPVTLDDPVPPGLPRGPGGQLVKRGLLVLQDPVRLMLGHRGEQLRAPVREVVEQLALAGAGGLAHVVQRRAGHPAGPEQLRRPGHDPLPGGQPLPGQRRSPSGPPPSRHPAPPQVPIWHSPGVDLTVHS